MNWISHFFRSCWYSLKGFAAAFRDETAFRQECALAVPHFLALALLPLSACERLALAAVWLFMIAVELLNTAIEAIVNLASPERHPLAGKAKDCASAAVSVAIILFLATWATVIVKLVNRS